MVNSVDTPSSYSTVPCLIICLPEEQNVTKALASPLLCDILCSSEEIQNHPKCLTGE